MHFARPASLACHLRRRARTVPGLRRGFFIPYDGPVAPAPYPALMPLFVAAIPACREVVAAIGDMTAGIERIARHDPTLIGARPARFEQDWFPRLDALAAYALVRLNRPARIVEIGSGHSTRFMAQAAVDGRLDTAFTCIDPKPRAPLDGLPLTHVARRFGAADADTAAGLGAGDILFVDSSHVAMPGSEVDRLLLDVLPRLAPGVLVHIHDVFLPDPYPEGWARRGYNEQIAIGALLQGRGFEIVFASRYVATRTTLLDGTVVARLPLAASAFEASLWLRKREA